MRRPNILQIVVDDLGVGDIGALNGGLTHTPAIDLLLQQGVTLTQHYAASPVCAPSRAALLTGRYPQRTGAISVIETRGLDRLGLGEVTLGDRLRNAGYATGLVGKWHNGALDPRYHPSARGFDEFVGFRGGWADYYDWRLEANDRTLNSDGRYLTDVLTEEAVGFIARHAERPFYLHLAYNAPHVPLQAPQAEIAPYLGMGLTDEVATLYGMVRRLDQGIGRVLEALEARGLAHDTVVVFVSDNGPQFAAGAPTAARRDLALQRFNAGLRGHKALVFEGGIRVPAVVRWPAGGIGGGRCVDAMTHFTDWFPTHLAMAGLPQPGPQQGPSLDGYDLTALLRGEEQGTDQVRYWQWTMYAPDPTFNAAVRDGRWKLVRPAYAAEPMRFTQQDWDDDQRYKSAPHELSDVVRLPFPSFDLAPAPEPYLFDLSADPGEEDDLAPRHPEVVARLTAGLERWFEGVEADRRAAAGA